MVRQRMNRRGNSNDDDDVSVDSCDFDDVLGSAGGKRRAGTAAAAATTEAQTERDTLARTENRIVLCMKFAVVLVLGLTAFFVSWIIYLYVHYEQVDNFYAAYDADATKLIEAFHGKIQNQIEALDALSVAITSHALATESTFPNVTLDDSAARFSNARVMSGSFMISYTPLVTQETRETWEAYSMENIHHLSKALQEEFYLQEAQNAEYDSNLTASFIKDPDPLGVFVPVVFELNVDGNFTYAEPRQGRQLLPIWHMSPIPPLADAHNLDIATHPTFAMAIQQTVRSGKAVLGDAAYLTGDQLFSTARYFDDLLARSQFRSDKEQYENDPMSAFTYPVFDTLDVKSRKVSGALGSVVYWRLVFKNVLPENTDYKRRLICVLNNTLGQVLSYEITNTVTFLGEGDWHNHTKFDGYHHNSSMIKAKKTPMEHKSLTSVALDVGHNSYTLIIYPTEEMEREYVTDDAIYSTIVILFVFAVTSIVFVLYTVAVARRQRVVMDRAVASGAIVSSLFPSQVRDQLYEENEAKTSAAGATTTQRRKDSFATDGTSTNDGGTTNNTRPIASVYENTTILFADMVGFTKWSSTRQPVQVFELLETLYQAFDAIAVRRHVFKVETIGDCYVAVTGLPEPQANHAVIMVKFADDCMNQMKQLTAELAETLGADTADLAMRVGMHSGSVTGGVLRGQKSRFQLFGDTMNTASRMESNGQPGRIHVSQETANALIAKGKPAWITPREDKIVAKGKGELQTYWVNPRGANSSTGNSESGRGSGSSDGIPEPQKIVVSVKRSRVSTRSSDTTESSMLSI